MFKTGPVTLAVLERAYDDLGITREHVTLAPQITPQIRAISKMLKRAEPHGPGTDLTTSWPLYLASSEDEDIRNVLAKHRMLSKAKSRVVPIEAFCVAAGVSPLRVLELLVAAIVRQGAQASTIIAAALHPRVVQKTVEMALTDDGIEDRNTLHKAVNFTPTPKGNTTIFHNNPTANASAHSVAQAAGVAPPPEQTIRRLSDRFNEARLLPAQTPAALPVVADARFGDAPERFAVPARITVPVVNPLEEEEDE